MLWVAEILGITTTMSFYSRRLKCPSMSSSSCHAVLGLIVPYGTLLPITPFTRIDAILHLAPRPPTNEVYLDTCPVTRDVLDGSQSSQYLHTQPASVCPSRPWAFEITLALPLSNIDHAN